MTSFDTHCMLDRKKAKFVRSEAECDRTWSGPTAREASTMIFTKKPGPQIPASHQKLHAYEPEKNNWPLKSRKAWNLETTRVNCNVWNWKLKDPEAGLKNLRQTIAKIAGRNIALIQHFQMGNGEKHRLQKELLDLRASANATESSARKESDTNQNLRCAHLSMKRELSQMVLNLTSSVWNCSDRMLNLRGLIKNIEKPKIQWTVGMIQRSMTRTSQRRRTVDQKKGSPGRTPITFRRQRRTCTAPQWDSHHTTRRN